MIGEETLGEGSVRDGAADEVEKSAEGGTTELGLVE